MFSINQDLMRSGRDVSRLDKQVTEQPQLSRVLLSPTNSHTESNFGAYLSSSQIRPDCGPELNWPAELREAHSLKSPNNLVITEHWNSLALITGQKKKKMQNLLKNTNKTQLCQCRAELSNFSTF